jgi:hypothetical protein
MDHEHSQAAGRDQQHGVTLRCDGKVRALPRKVLEGTGVVEHSRGTGGTDYPERRLVDGRDKAEREERREADHADEVILVHAEVARERRYEHLGMYAHERRACASSSESRRLLAAATFDAAA